MQRKIPQFLASAAPVAVYVAAGLSAAAPAYADTTITGTTTSAQTTSTAGNVTVAGTGTLKVASGAAATVDSSSTVTVNSGGTISAGTASAAVDGSIGVLINPGITTTITNAGTIAVLENYTPTSTTGSSLTGAISGVSNRYGIYGASGGTITGSISNTGSITVDGENSAAIQIDSTLNGSLTTSGTITVLGDSSYGIKTAAVTGNVTVGGTVTVAGSSAQGVVLSGDVGGIFKIDGAVTNSLSYTTSSSTTLTLWSTRLNTATPVVEVDGNVAGGILINAPTSSNSTDTDRGSIVAYGNNTALQIGGANNITIGAGTTDNGSYALGIDGSITATTTTSGIDVLAVSIGGEGGNVTLTNGMEVYGTVTASTADSSATAVLINSGSTVGSIFNTGTIKATATGQSNGNLYAIRDLSGSVTSITNQGYIIATSTTAGSARAIDLSANTSGVTITQSLTSDNQTNQATDKAATGYNVDTATAYAGITGDIYTGSGNDTLNIQSGTVTGNAYLGAGNNTVALADDSKWVGNIDFGSAGTETMTLTGNARYTGTVTLNNQPGTLTVSDSARWLGAIVGGSALDVTVNGGTFGANSTATSTVKSLTVGAGGTLRAYIDGDTGTSSKLVATTATFASGATISTKITSLANVVGTYNVLNATTLNGASTLTNSSLSLPVLFTGSVSTDANNVYVTIAKATASELGLTAAQASAYNAILSDAADNTYVEKTLLEIYDKPTLRGRFNEMLPDYAGGTFDIVTRASRLVGRHIDDDSSMFSISDTAAWLEPIVFRGTRRYGDTAGFKTSGGGLSAGFEKVTGIGNVGFTISWFTGSVNTGSYQHIKNNDYELGLFWRKSSGPLYIWARGAAGRSSFNSTRTFNGTYTNETTTAVTPVNFSYTAAGHWAGWYVTGTAGVSYKVPINDHWSIRPRGVIEYDRLQENSHIETGDTPIALTVDSRHSSQTTATTTLLAAWSSGPSNHEGRPFSVELEAGRRSHLTGNLGDTTASFETGDRFTVNGGHLPSAWVGQLSILQGGLDYTWKIGTDWERSSDGGISYGVRASISIAM
ncbi:autotransporter domain-containing protein [Novosphingobium nitrogenifigens]|nr:autotransporter domain-containing protein [Novosphingobium nitrogenifigens]